MHPSRTLYAAFGFFLLALPVQVQHQHAAGLTVKTRQDGITCISKATECLQQSPPNCRCTLYLAAIIFPTSNGFNEIREKCLARASCKWYVGVLVLTSGYSVTTRHFGQCMNHKLGTYVCIINTPPRCAVRKWKLEQDWNLFPNYLFSFPHYQS